MTFDGVINVISIRHIQYTYKQCLLVLQGRSIAKNLNKILLQIIKKRGLRVQIGNTLFFNISDDFYLLKRW